VLPSLQFFSATPATWVNSEIASPSRPINFRFCFDLKADMKATYLNIPVIQDVYAISKASS
jgi:hypothetical protein